MIQTKADNQVSLTGRTQNDVQPSTRKKPSPALWAILLVFILFVVIVFLTQHKEPISWIEDYNTGIEMAKRQNKPALLCFFKQGTHFSSDMWQNVYNEPEAKKYVKANFIPILIDVDKQPEIAQRYNVTYYPTHYVEYPDSNQIDGPFLGAAHLLQFIKKPRNYSQNNIPTK